MKNLQKFERNALSIDNEESSINRRLGVPFQAAVESFSEPMTSSHGAQQPGRENHPRAADTGREKTLERKRLKNEIFIVNINISVKASLATTGDNERQGATSESENLSKYNDRKCR